MVPLNLNVGSFESLEIHAALRDGGPNEIYTTDFVSSLLTYKNRILGLMGYAFFAYYCLYLGMIQYYDEWHQILIWCIIDSTRVMFMIVFNPFKGTTTDVIKANVLDISRIAIQIYYIDWDRYYTNCALN